MTTSSKPPRFALIGRKGWLHLHAWQKDHFGDIEGPVSSHVKLLAGGRAEVKYPYECTRCHAFAVVTVVEDSAQYERQINDIMGAWRRPAEWEN